MVKALIIEDNDYFRETLRDLLRSEFPCVTFEEAGDGDEALQKIEVLCPELILMDIKLPGESGLEITKKVRQSFLEVTIIILTNYDLPEYRDAALLHGANYFLSKGSSSTEDIIQLVDSVIKDMK
ncbi:MAG: response regulator transcription factor [Thermodesulfobacteriota bacterium]|nr:response regulator transcription factor [Thermodesulfobacteriota bacterium]